MAFNNTRGTDPKDFMTTNEQKCPVCESEIIVNNDLYKCSNKLCPVNHNVLFLGEMTRMIEWTQSRIDKEKAAAVQVAVQQERDRICKNLSSRRKHFMECIQVNSNTTAHQEPLGHINELAFLVQWLKVQINTGA